MSEQGRVRQSWLPLKGFGDVGGLSKKHHGAKCRTRTQMRLFLCLTVQDLVGIMQACVVGMNLDPTLYYKQWMNGSAFPAQVAVQPWWECRTTLQGEMLFNIIGENLGYKGGSLSKFLVNRKNVIQELHRDQVHDLSGHFIPNSFPWIFDE